MKTLLTLAGASALALLSLGAQAQAVTIDGQLTAAEVGGGNYSLVSRYTGPHGFAPSAASSAGIMALYAAADANNVYFFVVATLQNDGSPAAISNALQLLVARPGAAGVPVGTALPKPTGSNTSFQGFAPYLDLPGDMGIGIKGNGMATKFQVDGVVYAGGAAPTATAAVLSGNAGVAATGATATIGGLAGSLGAFNGVQVAYRTATSLNTNPGYGANGVGAVPAYGLEIAFSRASLGLTSAGGALRVFVLQNSGNGDYVSSDFIPQSTGNLPAAFTAAPNLAANPDFRLVPGIQATTITIGATTLGTRAADAAAIALGVYPNPVRGASTVTYQVAERASQVTILLTDLLGRPVRTVENAIRPVGPQTAAVDAGDLATGTYLLRVQVGEKVSTSKVAVL